MATAAMELVDLSSQVGRQSPARGAPVGPSYRIVRFDPMKSLAALDPFAASR